MALVTNTTTVVNNDRSFVLGTATPGSPATGMIRWNSSLTQFEVYNGSAWVAVLTNAVATSPLWSWGRNDYGQLGDNTTTSRSSPVSVVGGFTNWTQVSGGGGFISLIRANGTAWAFGFNGNGQLGDGSTTSRRSPVSVVGGFTDWVQISSSGTHTAAIRSNGTAWCWGDNGSGRLGDNTTTNRSSPVSVVGGFTNWIQINSGSAHTAAIRSDGTAWSWGLNTSGQLGDNTTTNRSSPVSVVGGFTDWVQISGGDAHTAAIRSNGTAWCWGSGVGGGLGDNTTSGRSSPVSVVGGFTDWVQISGGSLRTLAIRANGTAWGWGSNGAIDGGPLGDGTTTNRSSPVSVVGGFTDWTQISSGLITAAIRSNGTAWCWGDNAKGSIGDGTTTNRSSPVSVVGGFTDWVQIDVGLSGFSSVAALRAV